ncbi:hypothetical protein GCM10010201_24780 [Pilimelia columellifera subsp. columellifera]|uniref:DUF306 domain-containing protein n=1 Tax=Pilimelia columellifera subsp. columellifera TaxID=706583 RepID=A0ABN3NKU3_9ACTN
MLVGRWTPPPGTTAPLIGWPEPPYLQFADDGTWTGADGCNRQKGTWSVDTAGTFKATFEGDQEKLCENFNIGPWLEATQTVEINGDLLTLRDAGKKQLGQLWRAAGSAAPSPT